MTSPYRSNAAKIWSLLHPLDCQAAKGEALWLDKQLPLSSCVNRVALQICTPDIKAWRDYNQRLGRAPSIRLSNPFSWVKYGSERSTSVPTSTAPFLPNQGREGAGVQANVSTTPSQEWCWQDVCIKACFVWIHNEYCGYDGGIFKEEENDRQMCRGWKMGGKRGRKKERSGRREGKGLLCIHFESWQPPRHHYYHLPEVDRSLPPL